MGMAKHPYGHKCGVSMCPQKFAPSSGVFARTPSRRRKTRARAGQSGSVEHLEGAKQPDLSCAGTPTSRSAGPWRPPEGKNLKMNVDASWQPGDFLCSVAGVVRDAEGRMIEGFGATARVSSASEGETQAILHGISYMNELNSKHVRDFGSKLTGKCLIESDCSVVVDMVMGRADPPWDLKELVQRCKNGLQQDNNIMVTYSPRHTNAAADWVARHHRLNDLPRNWVSSPPGSLWNILCADLSPSVVCKTPI